MKTIQINVYGSPWSSNVAEDVYRFALQVYQSGSRIKRVFFYFDGVYHGLSTQQVSSDELSCLAFWKHLNTMGIDLLLCVSAATNRGVLDKVNSESDHDPVTMADIFKMVGLGDWVKGFADCDKMVTFK